MTGYVPLTEKAFLANIVATGTAMAVGGVVGSYGGCAAGAVCLAVPFY